MSVLKLCQRPATVSRITRRHLPLLSQEVSHSWWRIPFLPKPRGSRSTQIVVCCRTDVILGHSISFTRSDGERSAAHRNLHRYVQILGGQNGQDLENIQDNQKRQRVHKGLICPILFYIFEAAIMKTCRAFRPSPESTQDSPA